MFMGKTGYYALSIALKISIDTRLIFNKREERISGNWPIIWLKINIEVYIYVTIWSWSSLVGLHKRSSITQKGSFWLLVTFSDTSIQICPWSSVANHCSPPSRSGILWLISKSSIIFRNSLISSLFGILNHLDNYVLIRQALFSC